MPALPRSALAPRQRGLSKTRLLSGHRCIRKLWLELNGTRLARAGRSRRGAHHPLGTPRRRDSCSDFPSGILIEGTTGERIAKTQEVLAGGARVLFEASFERDGVYCSVDVLRKRGAGWVVTEVKSSTSVKPEHLLDTAIQLWVPPWSGDSRTPCRGHGAEPEVPVPRPLRFVHPYQPHAGSRTTHPQPPSDRATGQGGGVHDLPPHRSARPAVPRSLPLCVHRPVRVRASTTPHHRASIGSPRRCSPDSKPMASR